MIIGAPFAAFRINSIKEDSKKRMNDIDYMSLINNFGFLRDGKKGRGIFKLEIEDV
jgi:hypothetical protein